MKKGVMTVVALAAGLMLVSVVNAFFPAGGGGTSRLQCPEINRLKLFQKETLSLRDELITNRLELSREFSKKPVDRKRIAALQKKIVDIRTQIQQRAEEAGIAGKCSGRMGCDWLSKKGII